MRCYFFTIHQTLIDRGNVYIFTLNDEVAINGWMRWNMARFINHSCEPNCESRIVRDRVWLYALRSIRAGEELTYNYGYELDDADARLCRCGTASCVGYMVAEQHFDTPEARPVLVIRASLPMEVISTVPTAHPPT